MELSTERYSDPLTVSETYGVRLRGLKREEMVDVIMKLVEEYDIDIDPLLKKELQELQVNEDL